MDEDGAAVRLGIGCGIGRFAACGFDDASCTPLPPATSANVTPRRHFPMRERQTKRNG
jgi:hypothetical protein